MSSGVDLDLTQFINPDLTWKTVKKGPRSETRCSRKAAERRLEVGVGLGSDISKNVSESSVTESMMLGAEVLGERFTEKVVEVPLKKRKFLLQSKSTPLETDFVNHEGSISPQPHTPCPHPEEYGQPVEGKCASVQWCCSDANSKKRAEKKCSVDGGAKSMISKQTATNSSEHLSGVELLAIAACGGNIEGCDDHVESSGVEELVTPEGIELSTAAIKEIVGTTESESLSVQESSLSVVQSLDNSDENDGGINGNVPSKKARFHWDLNTVMDEWEEPLYDPLVNSQENCSEGIVGSGLQSKNPNLESCRIKNLFTRGLEPQNIAYGTENFANKSDSNHLFVTPASPASNLGSQADAIVNSGGQVVDESSLDDITILDFPASFEPHKLVPMCHQKPVSKEVAQVRFPSQKSSKSLDENKLTTEYPHSDRYGAEVSQREQRHLAGEFNMKKFQDGYDSPYEDGELREPIIYAREDNGVENKGKVYVGFEFDNDYEDNLYTRKHFASEKFQAGHEDSQTVEKTRLLVEDIDAGPGKDIVQSVEDVSQKPNDDENFEGNDSNSSNQSKNGVYEIRTSIGNMLHIEGSSPLDDLHGRGVAYTENRSLYASETYSGGKREIGLEKVMARNKLSCRGRSRNEVNDRWVNSVGGVWESRNLNGYPRHRNSIGSSVGKPSGLNRNDHGQYRSYGLRDMYRPLNRRQSPTDRNESYGIHRERLPMQGFRRDRSRGRSGFIPHEFRRPPLEEYHELCPYYPERKERFSPSFTRDGHISRNRRRSKSKSRSRSPIAWNMHNRERRRHSPDFRPYGRVHGETYQKPGFSGDFGEGFVSLPRGRRLSPQRNSRCLDDRKCMDRQYRDRRMSPPVRMFRRNPRFDSDGCLERLSSGEYFRPMTRS